MNAVLTPRELELLRLHATGAVTKEVATSMCMSYQTAKNHLTHVYRKLGVTNLVGAFHVLGWLRPLDDQTMTAIHESVYIDGWNAATAAHDLLEKAR